MEWARERIQDFCFLELFLDSCPFLNENSLCYLSKLLWQPWIQSDHLASDHTWQHRLQAHEGGLAPGLPTQSTDRCRLLLDTDELVSWMSRAVWNWLPCLWDQGLNWTIISGAPGSPVAGCAMLGGHTGGLLACSVWLMRVCRVT